MTPHQNNRQPVPVTDTAAICLQIDELTVLRGQRLVIDQLTHQQKHGELCILTGANGAGKSTTIKQSHVRFFNRHLLLLNAPPILTLLLLVYGIP